MFPIDRHTFARSYALMSSNPASANALSSQDTRLASTVVFTDADDVAVAARISAYLRMKMTFARSRNRTLSSYMRSTSSLSVEANITPPPCNAMRRACTHSPAAMVFASALLVASATEDSSAESPSNDAGLVILAAALVCAVSSSNSRNARALSAYARAKSPAASVAVNTSANRSCTNA